MGAFYLDGLLISAGRAQGLSADLKFGLNAAVGTAWERVSDIGGVTQFLTTAERINVTAAASDDQGSGGACQITLFGVDSDYISASEVLTLNGAASVATVNSYLHIHRAFVSGTGAASIGVNIGNIVFTGSTTGIAVAQITASQGQTLMLERAVPASTVFYVTHMSVSVAKGDDAELRIREYTQDGIWRTKWSGNVYQAMASRQFIPPIGFGEKLRLVFEAKTTNAGGSEVHGDFGYVISAGDS